MNLVRAVPGKNINVVAEPYNRKNMKVVAINTTPVPINKIFLDFKI